jgi:hypothetical protein
MNAHPHLMSMLAAERIADRRRDAAHFRILSRTRRTSA